MFLHIMVNQLGGRPIISHMLICFLPTVLWYNKPNQSKNHTGISLDFAENQIIFWDFKIWNSIRITEGSDNGDSDNGDLGNQGSPVLWRNWCYQALLS